ncbi:MAG: hypothetical protein ACO39Q_04210 [Ilumatobacteraceae bacterium]
MGNPHRTRWAAIGAAVAVTLGGGGLIGVSASGIDGSSALVAIAPVRILDTRQDAKVSGATRLLQVTGPVRTFSGSSGTETVVPDGASSVAINLTVTEGVRNAGYGFVTAFPCTDASDPVPNASTLNFVEGADVANGVVVPLGAEGEICLHVFGAAHLLVDVSGYYTDGRLDDIEADIAANAADIATNASGVATNAADIATNAADIATNVGDIATNAADIATNASDIETNVADIATNASGVATNAGDIATNASDIASNGSGIVDNGSQIARVAAGNFRGFVETPSAVGPSNSTAGIDIERGADGLPVMTRIASGGALTVTTCDDVGCVDEGEVSSVLDVGVVTDAALAIGADGMPVIAFRTATPELGVVVCTSFDCSTHRAPVILDDRAGTGETPDIAIGAGGNPVIVYTVDNPPSLSVVACDDHLCEGSGDDYDDLWTSAESAVYPQHPSVVINRAGAPIIAYQDKHVGTGLEFALFMYLCGDAVCAGGIPMVLQYTGRGSSNVLTGYHPSMIIGADGVPVVVYGEKDLNPDPDVWSIEAQSFVEGTIQVKSALPGPVNSTAVRIGVDGYPLIAYSTESSGTSELSLLQCSATSCDTPPSTTEFIGLDECGSAGCGLSMAMSGGGLPMIAYHDATGSSAVANVYVPWWTVGGR